MLKHWSILGGTSGRCAHSLPLVSFHLWFAVIIVKIGSLRTCISGQSCMIRGITGFVSNQDRFLGLDTCGSDFPPARLSPFTVTQDELIYNASNQPNISTKKGISWQSEISAAGGQYRLCWCTGSMVYLMERSIGLQQDIVLKHPECYLNY